MRRKGEACGPMHLTKAAREVVSGWTVARIAARVCPLDR